MLFAPGREAIRAAKAQLELKLASTARDNEKGFFKTLMAKGAPQRALARCFLRTVTSQAGT